MPSKPPADPGAILRRAVGVVVLLAIIGFTLWVIPRLGARSPVTILVLCALAILTMKLVQRRVRRWAQRWEEREAARNRRAGPRP